MNRILITTLVAMPLFAHYVIAENTLDKELAELDRTFFQRGFNQCDLNYLQAHIDNALVFYHDQGGVQDTDAFLANTQKYICNNEQGKPIRRLFPGSLQTYPLFNDGKLYGAIQRGKHAFYLRSANKPEVLTSTADFTHTWIKQGNTWRLSNVLSYNHQSPDNDESELLSVLNKTHVPALGIGIIESGQVKSTRVYGKLDENSPAPLDTLFKVASLTKPIVTLVTLKLVNAGKLSLDEQLSQYWTDPDLLDDKNAALLTPRIILMHQTGFPNWRWMSDSKKLSFNFVPGQGYGYSGEGFEYLRRALEAKFATTLEKLADKLVLQPAGMINTHFWWDENLNEALYAKNVDEQGNLYPLDKYYKPNAAANLITTIGDYSRFMQYVLNQQQVMPEIYHAMIDKGYKLGEHHYFGLGWEIFDGFSTNDYAVMHTGKDPGVNTLAVFFPETDSAYVLFMNGDNAAPVFEHMLPQLYLGKELWNRR
ncbi:serine hydrolase [Neptunicella sp. SCSIO 80796]|uniref:serine hydrolase n=1 Tax=Neptunicella plasticusilytica TaxID=3117012 RepID=UPI003A4E60FD